MGLGGHILGTCLLSIGGLSGFRFNGVLMFAGVFLSFKAIVAGVVNIDFPGIPLSHTWVLTQSPTHVD